jgi:leader peptidase (prepilin peptidase) / N-methyltransferase
VTTSALEAVVVGLLGLVVGSFLNVVITRLPVGQSVVRPPSACLLCATRIAWYDNLPLVSFVILRGACRTCGGRISWRYPAVEALTAALFVLTYLKRGGTLDLAANLALVAALIAITGIDLHHQIIPDVISLPGIAVGFAASLLPGGVGWRSSLTGLMVASALFSIIILASRGGMGAGDMKLGAMLGTFLGWKLVLLAILVAVFTGGALAIVLLLSGRKGRKDPIPFGPFLALGGLAALLWGDAILAWYLDVWLV